MDSIKDSLTQTDRNSWKNFTLIMTLVLRLPSPLTLILMLTLSLPIPLQPPRILLLPVPLQISKQRHIHWHWYRYCKHIETIRLTEIQTQSKCTFRHNHHALFQTRSDRLLHTINMFFPTQDQNALLHAIDIYLPASDPQCLSCSVLW